VNSPKAFALTVEAMYKRDVDLGHVIAAVEDALQGLLWENDRQIQVYADCMKGRSSSNPHTLVIAKELEHVYRS
jgi:hypothetical protein